MGFDLECSDKLSFKKMQDNFPTGINLTLPSLVSIA